MGQWPITRIPHIVDTNLFAGAARKRTGDEQPVILFLASAGIHDTRKGADLLIEALRDPVITRRFTVILVGPRPTPQEERDISSQLNHDLVFHGEARGDQELIDLYSQADITVVPSREDNMPITAMESQSCGTPVVAFRIRNRTSRPWRARPRFVRQRPWSSRFCAPRRLASPRIQRRGPRCDFRVKCSAGRPSRAGGGFGEKGRSLSL